VPENDPTRTYRGKYHGPKESKKKQREKNGRAAASGRGGNHEWWLLPQLAHGNPIFPWLACFLRSFSNATCFLPLDALISYIKAWFLAAIAMVFHHHHLTFLSATPLEITI